MAARRPFWKWHRWKSIGFCLWPPSTCIWNLKLKFQSKLDLCSGNHVVYRQTDRRTRWIQYTPPPTSLGGGIKTRIHWMSTSQAIFRTSITTFRTSIFPRTQWVMEVGMSLLPHSVLTHNSSIAAWLHRLQVDTHLACPDDLHILSVLESAGLSDPKMAKLSFLVNANWDIHAYYKFIILCFYFQAIKFQMNENKLAKIAPIAWRWINLTMTFIS